MLLWISYCHFLSFWIAERVHPKWREMMAFSAFPSPFWSCKLNLFLWWHHTYWKYRNQVRFPVRNGPRSSVQQYSLRKGKLSAAYALPDSNSHPHHSSITQVWGDTNFVMGINGTGLFVFDALRGEPMQFCIDRGHATEAKATVGPDDLHCPTFDYLGSRALVISRDLVVVLYMHQL